MGHLHFFAKQSTLDNHRGDWSRRGVKCHSIFEAVPKDFLILCRTPHVIVFHGGQDGSSPNDALQHQIVTKAGWKQIRGCRRRGGRGDEASLVRLLEEPSFFTVAHPGNCSSLVVEEAGLEALGVGDLMHPSARSDHLKHLVGIPNVGISYVSS